MEKTICKYVYSTEKSQVVKKYTEGAFGDADGYEETEDGKYFLYVNGGAESIHPAEDIKRMSKAKAEEWLESRK